MRAGVARRCLVLLVLGAVLAGCTGPVAQPRHLSVPVTARQAFGDFMTLDYCSLLDLSAFSGFGSAKFDGPGSFEACKVKIPTPNGLDISLSVGYAAKGETIGDRLTDRLPGEVEEYESISKETDLCVRTMRFADDITIQVDSSGSSPSIFDPCNIAKSAVDQVVKSYTYAQPRHRHLPANSFGLVDACAVISKANLSAVPGIGDVDVTAATDRHSCQFIHPAAPGQRTSTVDIVFDVEPLADTGQLDYTDTTIDGRPTTIFAAPESCRLYLAHIPFGTHTADDLTEMARVEVTVPSGQGDPCQAATSIATRVWAALPR